MWYTVLPIAPFGSFYQLLLYDDNPTYCLNLQGKSDFTFDVQTTPDLLLGQYWFWMIFVAPR